jgi:hypothetical protein
MEYAIVNEDRVTAPTIRAFRPTNPPQLVRTTVPSTAKFPVLSAVNGAPNTAVVQRSDMAIPWTAVLSRRYPFEPPQEPWIVAGVATLIGEHAVTAIITGILIRRIIGTLIPVTAASQIQAEYTAKLIGSSQTAAD